MKKTKGTTRKSRKIDLHLHTTLSDGENTVGEVIELAAKEGMKTIALTDHNLFAVTKRFQIGAGDSVLEVIPGCEFSTTYFVPTRGETTEIHVVGLFPETEGVNPDDFADIFAEMPEGKLRYVRAILDKLETLGISVSIDEVLNVKKTAGRVGRHQIAEVLIQKGYAASVDEAFDRYVGDYSPHYIPSTRFVHYAEMDVVVKRIKEYHGIPILCHAFGYSLEQEEIADLIERFADAAEGVGGIEVYYEKYLQDPVKMKFLQEQQKKYDLLISVASDRHRKDQPFAAGGDESCYQEMLRAMKQNNRKDWLLPWSKDLKKYEKLKPVYETHWHPYLRQYKDHLDEVMELMQTAGIYRSIVPSIEAYRRDGKGNLRDVNAAVLQAFEKYDSVYYAFSSHPKYIWKDPEWDEERWAEMEQLVQHPRCVAVGETGLDSSYSAFCEEHRMIQEHFFVRHIALANKYKLPVILHLRSGGENGTSNWPEIHEEALRILEKHPIQYGAVYHCFDGDVEMMHRYMQHGVGFFGIGGRILAGRHALTDALRKMPRESILLETDAPYINTHPEIHGPNTPILLYAIAEKVAEIRETTTDSIIETANENAERLFRVMGG